MSQQFVLNYTLRFDFWSLLQWYFNLNLRYCAELFLGFNLSALYLWNGSQIQSHPYSIFLPYSLKYLCYLYFSNDFYRRNSNPLKSILEKNVRHNTVPIVHSTILIKIHLLKEFTRKNLYFQKGESMLVTTAYLT